MAPRVGFFGCRPQIHMSRPLTRRPFALLGTLTFLLLLWSAVPPSGALAQEQQEQQEEQAQQQPALPDIAPREIEIRGQLQISLPSLQRQPLSGFNPPPRIPSISETRVPYVEPYEQAQSSLPQTLPEPPGMQATLQRPAPPLNGELAAGGGRYFTRHAHGKLWAPLTGHESFTLRGQYQGSNGHTPFDQSNVEAPYDTFEGTVAFRSQHPGFTFDAELGGFLDTYTLYGRERLTQPIPDREGRGLTLSLDLQTHGRVPVELRGELQGASYDTDFQPDATQGDSTFADRRLLLDGQTVLPLQGHPTTLDATFEMGGIGPDASLSDDVTQLDGGLRTEIVSAQAFTFAAGARLLTFSATLPPTAATRSRTYVAPAVQVDWHPQPGFSVYLQNTPALTSNRLADLYQENPYLISSPVILPTIYTTDAEAGLRWYRGRWQIAAQGGYRYAPSYRFFQSTGTQLFSVGYGSARIIHAGAEVSIQQTQGVEMLVGATVRDGQLNGPGVSIPYFAPLTARAMLSYAFNDQRGQIRLTSRFESVRYVDIAESEQVDAFFDLDIEASYDLTSSLGLTVQVKNLSTETLEQWKGYPQAPLVIGSGLRVRW